MSKRLFGTDGLRGTVNEYPMTPGMVLRLGLAAGSLFRNGSRRPKAIIGKDTRLSGYVFESALTAGLCASGMDVYQVGPLPTPAIAFLTRNMRAELGVVISASHNPYHDNGIKFFDHQGFKLSDAMEDHISAMITQDGYDWDFPPTDKTGRAYKIVDAPGRYIVYLKNSFPQQLSLKGLRVVIDCAHGANYKVAPLALEELGAEVIALNTSPDGLNINHDCGALHPEGVSKKVLEFRADIGIALDGDADRLIVVDEKGRTLDGDHIMALCADDMMSRDELHRNLLVTTVMSNMALDDFMEARGGRLLRTQVGDRYVMEAMRAEEASLGGEQSGHLIFSGYSTTGDGLLAALQVLRIMCERRQPLSVLADQLELYPQVLRNVMVGRKVPLDQCPPLSEAVAEAEAALAPRGRVLVRYSGTENLCRIMVEGKDHDLVFQWAERLVETVRRVLG